MSAWVSRRLSRGLSGVRQRLAVLLCGAALLAGGCSGPPGSESPTPSSRALSALWIDVSNPSIARDTGHRFTATGTFADGVTDDVTALVSWSETDIAPATRVTVLDPSGLAMGRSEGQAIITASLMGLRATTTLTVTAATLTGLTLSPSNPVIAKGTTQAFTATGTFSDGSSQDLSSTASWGLFDIPPAMDVALISGEGKAMGNSPGQATVTATVMGFRASTNLTVTAASVVSLAITPSSPTIVKGNRQQFKTTCTFSDGSVQDVSNSVSWSVAAIAPATNVAFISGRGLALATGVGKATISASLMGKTATTVLTVVDLTLTSLAVSPATPTIAKNGVLQFAVTGTYSDASTQDLSSLASWTTTDIAPAMNVASIDGKGLSVAKNVGTATITASYLGRTASTVLTVTVDGGICSADKWCWRNPVAQGQALLGTWALDATHVWAVGENGTILQSDGRTWSRVNSGTTSRLSAIWGTDATHIWAVGASGTVVLWDGTSWTKQATGITYQYNAIWGTDANHVWVVGAGGIVSYWNGTMWTSRTNGYTGSDLYGIWGSDTSHIWTVGSGGVIITWNGTAWAYQGSYGSSGGMFSVWGKDSSHVWIVGASGSIVAWNGTTWSYQSSGTSNTLTSVWGTDANHIWAAGANGTILKWTGSIWSSQNSGTTNFLRSVWGSDTGHIWSVGDYGKVIKGDGRVWTTQGSAVTINTISAVWGSDAGHIWAVGAAGTILSSDGNTWRAQSSGTNLDLYAVWGSDANHVWAVGESGTILMWDGTAWRAQSTGTSYSLRGVWGTDATHVWAVGVAGVIFLWDGSAWKPQRSGVPNGLLGIWGSDASHVWAVGDTGTVLLWDGVVWGAEPSDGTTARLTSVWGSDASHIWAVGAAGTMLSYDGSTWRAQSSGTMANLNSIWGSDSGNLWAVGDAGTVLQGDGSSWTAQNTGSATSLLGAWGTSASHLLAVGTIGTILEHSF